jgi:hypothetical protein
MSVQAGGGYSKSSPTVVNPYGGTGLHFQTAQRYNRQFARPFSMGFGFGNNPGFERRLTNRAESGNPFAQWMLGARGALGSSMDEATALQSQMRDLAQSGYGRYQQSVDQFLQQLPGFQQDASQLYTTAGGNYDEALDTMRQGRGVLDVSGQELNTAGGYANQRAQEAFSPLQQRALFQEASRRALSGLNEQGALAGVVGQGGTAAAGQDMLTQMALAAMQNENANQGSVVDQLAALAGQRGQLGSQYGALGAQEGALAGDQASTLGSLLGARTQLAQMGPDMLRQLFEAQPQLIQTLMSALNLPMDTAARGQAFLTGQNQPTMQLAELVRPQVGQRSKSFQQQGGASAK